MRLVSGRSAANIRYAVYLTRATAGILPVMRRSRKTGIVSGIGKCVLVAIAVVGWVGCIPGRWSVRTEHASRLEARASASQDLSFSVGPSLTYSETITVVESASAPGTFSSERFDSAMPIFVRLTNRTQNIITIDWDHTAFVDERGTSYKVLLPGEQQLPLNVLAVNKPPAPVIAPGSHIEVLVYPAWQGSDRIFFLPREKGAQTTFRVVFATVGGTAPHSELTVAVMNEKLVRYRSRETPWPVKGERCLPTLGCADGFACSRGRCESNKNVVGRDPNEKCGVRSPADEIKRVVEPFGGPCRFDNDCLATLQCVSGRCGTCE